VSTQQLCHAIAMARIWSGSSLPITSIPPTV